MKKLITILLVILAINISTAQEDCSCPEINHNVSNGWYIEFTSTECTLTLTPTDNITQTGSWFSNNLYHLGITPTNGQPLNFNNFTIKVNGEDCNYINGELSNGAASLPTFNQVGEDVIFKVFTIDGKYLGETYKRDFFNFEKELYILRTQRQSFKIYRY